MSTAYPQTWELDSLYPHPETPEFRQTVDRLKADLSTLASDSETLPEVGLDAGTVAGWSEFAARFGELSAEYTAVNAFISCHAAADAANRLFQRYEGELSALGPLWAQTVTNMEFAFQSAGADEFASFVAADPRLTENAYFLDRCRRNAALRLPKDQELLAADLDVDGLHAWSRLYDRISGDVRIRLMERGEIVEKSPGQVHWDSPQRSVRENNYYAWEKAWSREADTCADALNHIAGSRLSKYRRLGVDHLAVPLSLNRMSRETLDTMWSTICDRKGCLADYLNRKAELLGLEKLAWFDLQAPLPVAAAKAEPELSYDDACRLVIEGFEEFSPDLGQFAKMAIENRWIEVEDRPGKRNGGFCTDVPTRSQSRIFMTFTKTIDSMSTLAHELGHAYHTWVLRDQPLLLRDYPMNLAETASTFAEAVLGENRLKACETREQKLTLLDKMLSDSVAFLMNIHARFLFEDRFHQERAAGEVSASRLGELMVEAQQEAYLGAIASDGTSSSFWISKLHFYISGWPFYNFPYTFGYLLSQGAYAVAKDAPDFAPRFDAFLTATGCQDAENAVQSTLGYDLRKREFWDLSLDVVEARAKQFLELST